MLVKDVLRGKTRSLVTVPIQASIPEAMALMVEHNIGCLPVIDADFRLIGMVTDRGIFRKISEVREKYLDMKVEDVLVRELASGVPDEDVAYIADKMRKCRVRHIPIVDDDRVVGIVSLWDILKAKAKTEAENRYLHLCIDEQMHINRAGDD